MNQRNFEGQLSFGNDIYSSEIPASAYMSPLASGWRNQTPYFSPCSPRSPNPNQKPYSTPRNFKASNTSSSNRSWVSTLLQLLPFIALQFLFLSLFIPYCFIVAVTTFIVWIISLLIGFCHEKSNFHQKSSTHFHLPSDF